MAAPSRLDLPAPPKGDTTPIHDVTADMMEEAARGASRLADGVAHHTIPHDDHPVLPSADSAQNSSDAAASPPTLGAMADRASSAAREAATALSDAAQGATAAASTAMEAAADQVGALGDASAAALRTSFAAVDEMARPLGDTAAAIGGAPAAWKTDPGLLRSVASLQRYNAKLLDICQTNVSATGAFLTALMGARTVPEALDVNVDHMKRGMEALTGQSRELMELAQTLAADALRPFDGARGGT